jgi:hypothetical protein
MKLNITSTFALAALLLWPRGLCAQHIHINAGAFSTAQDAQLYFVNGNVYGTNAGYDVYLTYTNAGSFSNLYQGAGLTFTALASTPDNGGPAFRHAADGAYLQLQFVSVTGPQNGTFSVWEQDTGNLEISNPLFAIPVGTTNGTNQFNLSESDGSPGSDPYGHIHGRTFVADKPGLYTLGLKIIDTSANGTDGGPIHTPSDIYYLYFQAGLTISSPAKAGNSYTASFGTKLGATYFVEVATNLAATNWTTLVGPFTGNNYLQTFTDPNATNPRRFYRVKSLTP